MVAPPMQHFLKIFIREWEVEWIKLVMMMLFMQSLLAILWCMTISKRICEMENRERKRCRETNKYIDD